MNTARVNLDADGVTDRSEHMSTEHGERNSVRILRGRTRVKSRSLRRLTHEVEATVKPSTREKY